MSSEKTPKTAQTTGHSWDGDLQEFNNPLPTWWLWGFYATVVFAVIYWILYPAFPLGHGYTKGVLNDITYKNAAGDEVTTHWNTRSLLMEDMQQARQRQKPYIDKIHKASYAQIASDKDLSAFAFSRAKVLFVDNCAACHQVGGAGVIGLFPNLADDSWLWGGTYQNIETTIRHGRKGNMPSFKGNLSPAQIAATASYVLSLSGTQVNAANKAKGKAIFEGAGGCFACHTKAGTGQIALGSANLTDKIWTMAKVPGAKTLAAKKVAVETVIDKGIHREMPAWQGRLSDVDIKMLTYYVHQLGGGK